MNYTTYGDLGDGLLLFYPHYPIFEVVLRRENLQETGCSSVREFRESFGNADSNISKDRCNRSSGNLIYSYWKLPKMVIFHGDVYWAQFLLLVECWLIRRRDDIFCFSPRLLGEIWGLFRPNRWLQWGRAAWWRGRWFPGTKVITGIAVTYRSRVDSYRKSVTLAV